MPLGECISENFKVIRNNPTDPDTLLDLPTPVSKECCFMLYVLAEIVYTSENNNDKSSFIRFYDNAYTDAVMELQKFEDGEWVKVDDLDDDTYGTFNEFGFFVNRFQEKAMGYQIDWQKVLTEQGEGYYRVYTTETTVFGEKHQVSLQYCLKIYTPDRALGTVRFDWWMNNKVGSPYSDTRKLDYGNLSWFNQIRLRGLFGLNGYTYGTENVIYQNGEKVWISDEMEQEYRCFLWRLPNYIHDVISKEMLQADYITVTDYNNQYKIEHINRPIKKPSSFEYKPQWTKDSKLATVEMTFENQYKNFVKKRC
jgi:hypothetical protein